jgi:ribosomal protein S18 acetylase RimI-like enzyme/predicted nucleic acid-binding protein
MQAKNITVGQSGGPVYRAERDPAILVAHLGAIRDLADSEKEALGFLPESAYADAIVQRRLVAMLDQAGGNGALAGFILFGGVFPHARIQQVAVAPEHRRVRVASALVSELVSHLEARGYLTVTAAIASDLDAAQAFYESRGFVTRHTRQGGTARNRTIVLRVRDLETASFFSLLEPPTTPQGIDLGLRLRSAGPAPLYVIDLNVLFDLIRDRSRTALANRLFGAALAHQIRLAVAPEFLIELERTTSGEEGDAVLKLARQLPRLPAVDRTEGDRLSALVHDAVFAKGKLAAAGSAQALSDSRHLAEAALARASGYVTSDARLIAARGPLFEQIGIDVASLDEFAALLPADVTPQSAAHIRGINFETKPVADGPLRAYLQHHGVPAPLAAQFAPEPASLARREAVAVYEAGQIVAVGVCLPPSNIDAPTKVLVHVRPDHVNCETFADYLLDMRCQEACASGPMTIELSHIPGQATIRRAAIVRGFLPVASGSALVKVALGCPITEASWASIARQTRRRTGLRLGETPPDATTAQGGLVVHGPDGKPITIRMLELEDAIGPTVMVWPGRDGVIVPIAKVYADDLLGTSMQLNLFGSPEASFVARRTYFNSPRTAGLMRPTVPVLFYESKRSGGRGAVVAAARIVDATVVPKEQVPDDLLRRAVVEDVEPLSASEDVLATSFTNLLRFPAPVSFAKLREIGAAGTANLQTTSGISAAALSAILELGWSRG